MEKKSQERAVEKRPEGTKKGFCFPDTLLTAKTKWELQKHMIKYFLYCTLYGLTFLALDWVHW